MALLSWKRSFFLGPFVQFQKTPYSMIFNCPLVWFFCRFYYGYNRNIVSQSSLVSKASCQYRVSLSLRFLSIFCCMGHANSQIQIHFSHFVSSIKSVVFLQSWLPRKGSCYCSPRLFLAPIFVQHRVNSNELLFFCPKSWKYHYCSIMSC